MTVTQRLMKPGGFALELVETAPTSAAAAVALADHIVVTGAPLDSISSFSDATILANSIYTGVITSKPNPRSFAGYDLSWHMGTPDGLGECRAYTTYYDPAIAPLTSSQPLSVVLSSFISNAHLNAGTWNDSGLPNFTGVIPPFITPREVIDMVTRTVGAEWRANPNGTLDAALAANLFVTSPTIVVTRKKDGVDGAFRGLTGSINLAEDIEQYTYLVLGAQSAVSYITSAASAQTYPSFLGATVLGTYRAINVSGMSTAAATATTTAAAAQFSTKRQELTLSSLTYDVTRFVHPGDYVYAYDEEANLIDTANQINWQGQRICPQKLRVYALTWPIQRGMGVYARKYNASTLAFDYTDLTPYVNWEGNDSNPGEVQWEVGAAARSISDDTSTIGSTAYLGANPAILAATLNTGWTTWNGKTLYNGSASAVAGTGEWEFDGDYINLQMQWLLSGIPTTGTITIALPLPAIHPTNSVYIPCGDVSAYNGTHYPGFGTAFIDPANPSQCVIQSKTSPTTTLWTNAVPFAWSTGHAGTAILRYRWR